MADEMLSQEEIEALMSQSSGSGTPNPEPDAASEPPAGHVPDNASGAADESSTPDAAAIHSPAVEVDAVRDSGPVVQPVTLNPMSAGMPGGGANGVELILDVQLQVSVELGRSVMPVRDVLALGPGSVVELDTHAGEPVEVVVNNKTVAKGEVVIIDENFGVRITEIVNGGERESRARAA